MKTIVLAACLTLVLTSASSAVTGGVDYAVVLLKDFPAETKATLVGIGNQPVTETRALVGRSWVLHPSDPSPNRDKSGDRGKSHDDGRSHDVLEVKVARVEYAVPVNGTSYYTTTIHIRVSDSLVGEIDCVFKFEVTVNDHAFGPVVVIGKTSANDIDSDEFDKLTSNKRCQVFPATLKGPLMYIYSDSAHIP